jgi:YspA, cpYpsA-related SLOG family
MRVLVCGDRNWTDYDLIVRELNGLGASAPLGHTVIDGMARGADSLGNRAAMALWPRINHMRFPAQWDRYGRGAGPVRNQRMLDEGRPDLVLAFHDDLGHSKGTAHMVRIAKKAGVPVRVITHACTTCGSTGEHMASCRHRRAL